MRAADARDRRPDRQRTLDAATRLLRWAGLAVLVAATIAASLTPVLFDMQPWDVAFTQPLWYIVPGLVVMARRPWHQIGWLLILLGLGLATTSMPPTPAVLDPGWYPWFSWVSGAWGGYFTYTIMAALLVSFPDGLRRRSRRDRLVGRSIVSALAAMTVVSAIASPVAGTLADGTPGPSFDNPLGLHLAPRSLVEYGFIPVIASIGGCVFWLWRRQRLQEGEERRRYTLVLYAFSLLATGLMVGIALSEVLGPVAWLLAYAGWFIVPVAFATAVVRHGLYGVDRLVRRTVTYGVVGVLVGSVYAVPVVLLPRILGESTDLVIAISTLAAAAVFNPARRWVQRGVDRRFDRRSYDADGEIESFSSRLRSEVHVTAVTDDLAAILVRTVAPSAAAIWIRDRSVTVPERLTDI